MSKKVQRQYSAELKASAVKMVIGELKTLCRVSQDLHILLQTLHSWVNKGRGELSGVAHTALIEWPYRQKFANLSRHQASPRQR